MTEDYWLPPTSKPELGPSDVHIWRVWLDVPESLGAKLKLFLSDDEVQRADRFYFDRHRARFIAGRGILRHLLADYLKDDPAALRFTYGRHGKPEIAGEADAAPLRFNIAHSNQWALLAVTRGRLIGVDVEFMRPLSDAGGLALRYFSANEYAGWLALPDDEKRTGFFRLWARKEAFLKAIGSGLAYPLDSFDVSVAPQEPARLISIAGDADRARSWTMRDLNLAVNYSAAIAVDGTGCQFTTWHFTGLDSED